MDQRPGDRVTARFLLRHRRPSLLRLALPGALALLLGVTVLMDGGLPNDEWPVFLSIVLGAILAPFILFGLLARPEPQQWMEVRARSVVLPSSAFSREAIEIPISEVRSIYARLTRQGTVWIETSYRTFSFPIRVFESIASAALLVDRVRECIRGLPDGDDRIVQIDRDARIAERALSTRHPATIGAITLLVIAGFLVQAGGGLEWTFGLVRFGANVDFLVEDGELHRLLASLFLHSSLIHLGFVVFGIASAGAIVERLVGATGTTAIMLASGAAGAIAMHAGESMLSAGASPIVFGLMGAAAFVTFHHRDRIPTLLRPTAGMWTLIGVLTLPIALIPEVDFNANIGGLLAGVVTGAALAGDARGLPLRGWHPRAAVVGIAILGVAYLASAGAAVHGYRSNPRETDLRMIERYLHLDRDSYIGLNRLAWELAIDPSSGPRTLDLAEIAGRRAVERSPDADVTGIEDTLATVQYRRGRYREAVAIEKRVLADRPDPFIASQLARFLHALAQTSTSTHGVTARFADGAVEVASAEPMNEEAAIYAVAVKGDRVGGLITFPLEAGATSSRIRLSDGTVPLDWANGATLVIGSVDAGKTVRTAAWPMNERAAELP